MSDPTLPLLAVSVSLMLSEEASCGRRQLLKEGLLPEGVRRRISRLQRMQQTLKKAALPASLPLERDCTGVPYPTTCLTVGTCGREHVTSLLCGLTASQCPPACGGEGGRCTCTEERRRKQNGGDKQMPRDHADSLHDLPHLLRLEEGLVLESTGAAAGAQKKRSETKKTTDTYYTTENST